MVVADDLGSDNAAKQDQPAESAEALVGPEVHRFVSLTSSSSLTSSYIWLFKVFSSFSSSIPLNLKTPCSSLSGNPLVHPHGYSSIQVRPKLVVAPLELTYDSSNEPSVNAPTNLTYSNSNQLLCQRAHRRRISTNYIPALLFTLRDTHLCRLVRPGPCWPFGHSICILDLHKGETYANLDSLFMAFFFRYRWSANLSLKLIESFSIDGNFRVKGIPGGTLTSADIEVDNVMPALISVDYDIVCCCQRPLHEPRIKSKL